MLVTAGFHRNIFFSQVSD